MSGTGLLDNPKHLLDTKRLLFSEQLKVIVDVITSTANAPFNKCGLVKNVEDGSD